MQRYCILGLASRTRLAKKRSKLRGPSAMMPNSNQKAFDIVRTRTFQKFDRTTANEQLLIANTLLHVSCFSLSMKLENRALEQRS